MPPETTGARPAHSSHAASSESQFLTDQAAQAKAAIARSLSDLKTELGQVVNPVDLTRKHPWISVGATALAGFLAASAVVPSKEQQALNRLAKIEAALQPAPVQTEQNGSHAKNGKPSLTWLQTLTQELFKVLGPLLGTLVSNLTAPPPPTPDPTAAANPPDHSNPPV